MDIILASASPRRRELFKVITECFSAVSTDADETLPDDIPPDDASAYLAVIKAESAVKLHPDSIIIGCDTTVICDGRILGKPRNAEQCREFLRMLSGKTHHVVTGCAILFHDKKKVFSVSTDVTFRALSDEDINWYVATDEPYDKAGGYAVQGSGALLVEGICGDYFNVVGLPVSRLNTELTDFINSL